MPVGTGSVGPPYHFFGAPGIPAKFRWSRTKIRGTSESKVGIAKNGQNPARRPKNGPPSGRTASYRKTKVIQSYLRMWGRYYPIESGPWDHKKWGLYGHSVKKCRFSGQKWAPAAAPRPAVRRSQHKKVVFLVSRNNGIKKFGRCLQKIDFGPKNSIFGQQICLFLRYTHITPIFCGLTDPTQWDNIFPTSWGNSG